MRELNGASLLLALSTALVVYDPACARTPDQLPAGQRAVSNPDAGLGEIVVTAEKRETNLQHTPIAVTAIGADLLAETQTHTIQDLVGRVPSLQIGDTLGIAQLAIRGVGSTPVVPGAESAVAINDNGVYVARPSATLNSFFDVASVEVLRGPQGTLYGRNATAGSINIATIRPTDQLAGDMRVTVGNYDTANIEAGVGGPIAGDKLLIRIAGMSQYHSGFGVNIKTGTGIDNLSARAGRITLVAKPSENLVATIIGEYYYQDDHGGSQHYLGAVGNIGLPGESMNTPIFQQRGGYVNTRLVDIASDFDPIRKMEAYSAIGTIEWKRDELSIKSISGYRGQKAFNFSEISTGVPTAATLSFSDPAHQFSQELSANYTTSRFNVTGGLYYFREVEDATIFGGVQPYLLKPPVTGPAGNFIRSLDVTGDITTDAKAAFTQASYQVVDKVSLTAGVRYSTETKDIVRTFKISATDSLGPNPIYDNPSLTPGPSFQNSAKFSAWTPKFGIEYQITPATLAYVSYAKGFRSGTFDLSSAPTSPALQPEKVEAFEGGLKSSFFMNRLRTNLAAFHYNYTNLAVSQSTGTLIQLVNAAAAKVYGVEAEVTARPVRQLELEFSGSYTHSEFTKDYCSTDLLRPDLAAVPMTCNGVVVTNATVNYKGNSLPNAPDWRLHAAAEYTFEVSSGRMGLRGEADYVSTIYFFSNNLFPQAQGGNEKFNAFLNFESPAGWRLSLYGRNLTDKITVTSYAVAQNYGGVSKGSVSAPRTFGAEFGYKF